MRLSELLVAKQLVSQGDLDRAFERQQREGGRLVDSLVALKLVSSAAVEELQRATPVAPSTVADTGLKPDYLLKFLAKMMAVQGTETIGELRDALKLPAPVISNLLNEGVTRKLVEQFGSAIPGHANESRFRLTLAGKNFAADALAQNQYVGPVPVTLAAYREQVLKQAIGNEIATPAKVAAAFSDMVVSDAFVRRVGPSLNSGKSLLLYGPPGNGKTTIAEKIGTIYEDVIFVPYCIEVAGDIITVFDSNIHQLAVETESNPDSLDLRREEVDRRWAPCRRPMVITGGELTLSMLDLKFNPIAKFYDAPLHVKAQGGVFVIDDFGRQLVRPEELLNRWIVPLERRVDFLKLHTGKQFEIPFDQLVIFSTNMTPNDLMDGAFLRRIPYKLEVDGPTEAEFAEILARICAAKKIPASADDVAAVIATLKSVEGTRLACYQAKFVVDQIISACRFLGIKPHFSADLVADAVVNMYARSGRSG